MDEYMRRELLRIVKDAAGENLEILYAVAKNLK